MASGISYRQDLAPKGGFDPIDFTKKVSYKKTNGWKIIGIVLAVKALGYVYVKNLQRRNEMLKTEKTDARLAESVFRLAETDRLYLKYLRDMRDEERELMKDVPGWEVGTLFGEPIYHKEKTQFYIPTLSDHKTFTNHLGVVDYISAWIFHR